MIRSFGVETLDVQGYYAWAIVSVKWDTHLGLVVDEVSSLDVVDISEEPHRKLTEKQVSALDPDVLHNLETELGRRGISAFEDSLESTGDEVEY